MQKISPFSRVAAAALCLFVASAPWAAAKDLKLAYAADPVSLDPHEQLSGGTLQFSHMVFDPLLRWTQDLQFEPRLAESWERIDDLTMRFVLAARRAFSQRQSADRRRCLLDFRAPQKQPRLQGLVRAVRGLRRR